MLLSLLGWKPYRCAACDCRFYLRNKEVHLQSVPDSSLASRNQSHIKLQIPAIKYSPEDIGTVFYMSGASSRGGGNVGNILVANSQEQRCQQPSAQRPETTVKSPRRCNRGCCDLFS